MFAVPSLEAVRAAGHDVSLVVTQPDRPAGRGRKSTPSPVAVYARDHGLLLWQTSSLRGPEAEERLRAVGADAMALAAFSALVPANVLALTPGGILNVHPSLLPRWRGAAPIQAALLAGDTSTGVTIIRLVSALDAGPILLQSALPIAASDDFVTLEPRLATLGAGLLVQALAEHPEPQPQDDARATYCQRIAREDARIDWSRPGADIWHQVRAYRGWPQAFTTFGGQQLKVLRAWALADGVPLLGKEESAVSGSSPESPQPGLVAVVEGAPLVVTGEGLLRLDEVQLEGKRAVSGAEFLRGYPRLVGAVLGAAVA